MEDFREVQRRGVLKARELYPRIAREAIGGVVIVEPVDAAPPTAEPVVAEQTAGLQRVHLSLPKWQYLDGAGVPAQASIPRWQFEDF